MAYMQPTMQFAGQPAPFATGGVQQSPMVPHSGSFGLQPGVPHSGSFINGPMKPVDMYPGMQGGIQGSMHTGMYPGMQGSMMQGGMYPGMQGGFFGGMQPGYPGADGLYPQGYVCQAHPEIRNGFITKAYSLLAAQLFVTFLVAVFIRSSVPEKWLWEHVLFFRVAGLLPFILVLVVSCCFPRLYRTYPWCYIFMGVVDVLLGVSIGFMTMFYSNSSVLIAVLVAGAVFLALTVFAACSRSDFTGIGPYLFVALMVLLIYSYMMWILGFFVEIPGIWHIIGAGVGCLLFSLYIVFDTQRIVGGGKYAYGVDDYAPASLSLYLDVVNLFMDILHLTGGRQLQ